MERERREREGGERQGRRKIGRCTAHSVSRPSLPVCSENPLCSP